MKWVDQMTLNWSFEKFSYQIQKGSVRQWFNGFDYTPSHVLWHSKSQNCFPFRYQIQIPRVTQWFHECDYTTSHIVRHRKSLYLFSFVIWMFIGPNEICLPNDLSLGILVHSFSKLDYKSQGVIPCVLFTYHHMWHETVKVNIRQIFVYFWWVIFGIWHDKQVDATRITSLVWLQHPISFSSPDMISQIFTYTGVNDFLLSMVPKILIYSFLGV